MKLSILVILVVLAYFVWTWWQGRTQVSVAAAVPAHAVESYESPPVPTDDVPQGPGIIMYGTDGCPWCVKQKQYFAEKEIEYTFKDCEKGGCPNFVSGYPTIVKDGKAMPGYQEL
jgi:hypothetical protein